MTDPAGDDTRRESHLDELLAEYLRRLDAGEKIERYRFLQAHHDFAGELQELLETADLIDRMAGPILAVDDPQDRPDEQTGEATAAGAADTTPSMVDTIGYDGPRGADAGREPPVPVPRNLAGRKFGNYELLEEIGRGGMGVVYKARQVNINRIVAVKMILSERLVSESNLKRFYAEAQAAGKLRHPNIVSIHQVGEVDGCHFYSMDYIEGKTLTEIAREESISPERVARYLKTIAEAVHYAHRNGVLHRDLKPANLLIDADDQPQVTDFGLAKQVAQESDLTSSGAALGTPSYMPPEQAAGRREDVGPASDVYSLGAILYELLTGQPPFKGESAIGTLLRVMHDEPASPLGLNPGASRDLATICMKCLQKNPRRRYASAQTLADDLERFLNGEPIRAKPVGKLARAWHWTRGVPLIAALTGRELTRISPGQRRAQWVINLVPLAVLLAAVVWMALPETLPKRIRIASGGRGGMYHRLSTAFAPSLRRGAGRAVDVLETSGSLDNGDRLLAGQAELALLQSGCVSGEEVAVVAPLYFEVVHVVVRKQAGIASIADLEGKAVSLGPTDSGMRLSALKILDYHDVDPKTLSKSTAPFSELLEDETLQAAMVTIGFDNSTLKRILLQPQFALLPIGEAERFASKNPGFKSTRIHRKDVPEAVAVPAEGIPTVMTPAFLAVRGDAPDLLVETVLVALYRGSDLVDQYHLIPLSEAAAWGELNLHPAARRFFQTVRKPASD